MSPFVETLLGYAEAEGASFLDNEVQAIEQNVDVAEDHIITAASTVLENAAAQQKGVFGGLIGGGLKSEIASLVPGFETAATTASNNLINELQFAIDAAAARAKNPAPAPTETPAEELAQHPVTESAEIKAEVKDPAENNAPTTIAPGNTGVVGSESGGATPPEGSEVTTTAPETEHVDVAQADPSISPAEANAIAESTETA